MADNVEDVQLEPKEKDENMEEEDKEDSDSEPEESSDDEDADAPRILELEKQISENQYLYDPYIELINLFKKQGELEKLRDAREKMSAVFPLTPDLWLEWIRDEISCVEKYDTSKDKVYQLCDRAVKDYLSEKVWLEYCQYVIGEIGQPDALDKIRGVFDRALTACGLMFNKGGLVWDTYREFENAILAGLQPAPGSVETKEQKENIEGQTKRIANLFKRQLAVPHMDMQTTLMEYKEWSGEDQIDPYLKTSYDKALEKHDKRLPFEDKLTMTEAPHLEEYNSYIDFEISQGEPARVKCIFERALTENCLVADLWIKYSKYLDVELGIASIILGVYERAIRNCPWSSALWLGYVRAMERHNTPHEKVKETFDQALNAGFSQGYDYLTLWTGYCDYLRRRISWDQDHEKQLEDLRATFEKALEHLSVYFPQDGDPDQSLRQYWARIEAKFCKNMEKARELWNEVMQAGFGNNAYKWLDYFNLERAYGDHKHCRKIMQRAINSVSDYPDLVMDTYVEFERMEGTLEQYDAAVQRVESQRKRLEERAQQKAAQEASNQKKRGPRQDRMGAGDSQGMGKKGKDPPGRKKDWGQGEKGTKDKVNQRLQDEQQMQTAQVYKRKRKSDTQADEPPSKKESTEQQNEGFKVPKGPATQSPTKKSKVAPPPGYKTSSQSESTLMPPPPPGYKAKVTAPPPGYKPKPEQTEEKMDTTDTEPGSETRTAFISNLSYTTDEVIIREIFKDVGEIQEIRLIKGPQDKSKGYGYVDFKEEASLLEALKMDRTPIEGRPMFVSKYKERSNNAENFKYKNAMEKNKLFVKNLPFTITKEAMEKLFGEHGKLKEVRLVTYRSGAPKGIAFVEYENETDAAHAVMKTDGLLIGEHNISVAISDPPKRKTPLNQRETSSFQPSLGGGKKETLSRGKARTQISMVPRSLQRTPAAAASSTSTAPLPSSAPSTAAANGSTNGAASKPETSGMSNADFRNMLLKK